MTEPAIDKGDDFVLDPDEILPEQDPIDVPTDDSPIFVDPDLPAVVEDAEPFPEPLAPEPVRRPPIKPAKWTVAVKKRSTDDKGTLHVEGDFSDRGERVAEFSMEVTESRALRLIVTNLPGHEGFSDFQAWMTDTTEEV